MNATKLLFLFVFCVNIIYVSTDDYVNVCLNCDIVHELFIFIKSFLTRYIEPKYHDIGCLSYIFYGDKRNCNMSSIFKPLSHRYCAVLRNRVQMPRYKKIFDSHGLAPSEDDMTKWLKYTKNEFIKTCLAMHKFNQPVWSPPTHYDFTHIFHKIILKWVDAYSKRWMNGLLINKEFSKCVKYLATLARLEFFSNETLADD